MQEKEVYLQKLHKFMRVKKIEGEVEALTPDASTRRYFRLRTPNSSYILMVMGPTDRKIVFEEFLEKYEELDELPFLNIERFLLKNGVRVPRVFDVFPHGFPQVIMLEDFGDTPLDVFVSERGFESAQKYYEDAIEQLVRMQSLEDDGSCFAFRFRFSEKMFLWEFQHFVENFFDRVVRKRRDYPKDELMRYFAEISVELGKLPRVFTHRDYHSKNLMCLPDGKVGILDFQDALLGPEYYDLASLLEDAYVKVPEKLKSELKRMWAELKGRKWMGNDERLYLKVGVQRMLKAAGRFLYIWFEKKNPKFLRYVSPATENALECLEKLGDRKSEMVRRIIAEHLPRVKEEVFRICRQAL